MSQNDYLQLNYEPLQNEIEIAEIVDTPPQIQEQEEEQKKEVSVVQMTFIQTLHREYGIIKAGFTNQEFRDYCMVKGALQQTIPLLLFVPLLMILGTTMCILVFIRNIKERNCEIYCDPIYWELTKTLLFILFSVVISYAVFKSCEIIPKVVRNPLLFGRCTTYLFIILLVIEGFLLLEYAVLKRNPGIFKNDFWTTLALLVWQKLLMAFVYDIRLRAAYYFCIYIYFALRLSQENEEIIYNLYKCSIYLCAEVILVIDIELKNYASYQQEIQMTQTNNKFKNKEQVQFMIPPVTITCQQQILQNYSDIFPVALFDQTRQLLHLSGIMQKQLKLDVDTIKEEEASLLQAELIIRQLEIINLYDEDFNKQKNVKKLVRQSKFGATCGLDQDGKLLHSLINGPALQQLRNGAQGPQYLLGAQQPEEQQQGPRHLNFNNEGKLDKIMGQLMKCEKDSVQGLVQHKIKLASENFEKNGQDVKFYQFTLTKVQLSDSFGIVLVLEDVTSLMSFLNSKQKTQTVNTENIQQLKELCLKTRSFAANQQQIQKEEVFTYDILRQVQNIESKLAVNEQSTVHVFAERLDVDNMIQQIKKNFDQRFLDKENKFIIDIDEKLNLDNFLTDNLKLQLIVNNLLENSLEATKNGVIKFQITPDIRGNCISICVEDNGCGIPNEFFAKLNQSNQIISELLNSGIRDTDQKSNFINPNPLGIDSSNYNVKVLGPYFHCRSIDGNICSTGLQIQSELDVGGTKIRFSIRNMKNDSSGQLYLIDKSVDDFLEDLDAGQEEIQELYINGKVQGQSNIFLIPRANKFNFFLQTRNIKCQIFKQQFSMVETSEESLEKGQSKQMPQKPKLAGLEKLQRSGKIGQVVQKNRGASIAMINSPRSAETQPCLCDGILLVNSDQLFYDVIKAQQINIPWFSRAHLVNEKESFRQINRKLKEQSCSPQCQGFSTIIFNCSNNSVDYSNLINSIISLYANCQIRVSRIIALSYRTFGNVPQKVLQIQMPNLRWTESIQ